MQCKYSNFWTRAVCKQCEAEGPGMIFPPYRRNRSLVDTADTWKAGLNGSTDATITNDVSQILVVYPLPSFVDEDSFATDIKKLELTVPKVQDPSEPLPKLKSTAPSSNPVGVGARPNSVHRVFLMRDVRTKESFKYGFVEFWTKDDAVQGMAKFKVATEFIVAGCPVKIEYIHMGVFAPVHRTLKPEERHMTFKPLFNPEITVEYRDPHLYPSQKVITTEPPVSDKVIKSTGDPTSAIQKTKKRKGESGKRDDAPVKKHAISSQMAMWEQKHKEIHGKTGKQDEPPKIKMSLSNIKLGGPAVASTSQPKTTEEKTQEESPIDPITNREKIMCFLCMLKFKDLDTLDSHELTPKHIKAMSDPAKMKEAQEKYRRSVAGRTQPDQASSGPEYRDRAKERREKHNQPDKPKLTSSEPKAEGQQPKPKPEDAKAKPGPSKGAAMLEKLGYKPGSGLGASGDGRVDAITANLYQEGVGLGADGGNLGDATVEAERKTKGSYKEYVDSVHDKARERFKNL